MIVLPVVLFITGIQYLENMGCFFLKGVDPEYAYLFNGLLLADGKPDIDYVYHPGTPMLCVIATVIRVLHLFRPGGLIPDVIANPEVYIRATIYFVNFLGSIMLFFLGFYVYRRIHQIATALVFQFVPFVHNLALEPLSRLIPESLMLSITCMWLMMLVRIATDPEPARNAMKYSLLLGILTGLSVADKLTLLPYVVIPLFLLPGLKHKARFAGTALFSFVVFAFPVLYKLIYFYHWVTNIITHTGRYGSGDKGLLQWSEFTNNLALLIHNTPWLVVSWVLLIAAVVIRGIGIKNRESREHRKARLSVALIILVVLQFFISAKQFAYHYMLPAILLTIPMILLTFSLLQDVFPLAKPWIRNTLMSILMVLAVIHIVPRVSGQLKYMAADRKKREQQYQKYMESRPAGPVIISASYYGCAAIEYALMFGLHESGKYAEYLYNTIGALYPGTYLYLPWSKAYYAGKKEVQPASFISQDVEYNLYISEFSEEKLEEIISSLKHDSSFSRHSLNPVYVDSVQHEALFRVQFF